MSKASVAHVIQDKYRTGDVLINENVDFSGLLLSASVLQGLQKAGFQRPSPIQLKAIPLGRCGLDLIVQAKSGTGKTCVFSVIALEGLQTESYALQVLVLAPTREIAIQIWDVICSIGQCIPTLKCHTFIGGMPVTEDKQKLKKCHIAVGTPGRIKQLIETGIMNTDSIRMFVLDEADKLLEESFQEQINWIYSALPENKQMLALSATYPEYLAQHLTSYMRNPTFLRLNISDPALLGIKQFRKVVAYHAMPNKVFDNKTKVVIELLSSVNFQQCLIFSNLQTRAQNMADVLISHGWPTACIAGSHDQRDRNEAMSQLKTYKCRVLISTDLTSRGIDADKVNMVINLDVPKDHETYLHRIGRAGRFGTFGAAVTIVSHGQEEKELNKVEKKCNTHIKDLPDPIPSTLTKSEGTFNLDDMVSTEQIITDHTRISPKKIDVKENQNSLKENSKHQSIANRHSQKSAGRKHLQNVETEFEQRHWRDKKREMSVSADVKSEKGIEKFSEPLEMKNDIGFPSTNERGDFKVSAFESLSGSFQGNILQEEDSPDDVHQSSNDQRKIKQGIEVCAKPAEIFEEREMPKKTSPKKRIKKAIKMHIPQLEEFLCHKDKQSSKSYEEKEREYKKYLEERETSYERGEITIKPTPFVWKEGEKEQLLSMIDTILSVDDHSEFSEQEEQEDRKDNTSTATQTESFVFIPGVNDGYTSWGQKQTKKDSRRSKPQKKDVSENSENTWQPINRSGLLNDDRNDVEQSKYCDHTGESEYEQEHEHDYRGEEWCSDEVEHFVDEDNDDYDEENDDYDDQCEKDDDFSDEHSEHDEGTYKEPKWNDSWSPYVYPPPYMYNPYFSMPYASHQQMTHAQRTHMFHSHLTTAQQQQNHYLSAMLANFYQHNA
ncbi:LOW QUALITY PROTEIN: probable ATP-dependent RNA helicase DDX20 [Saccostrea cucullata]|uniref:LOW QUALITY PROTEIN: probable ATP-dependent RNA helicase DDX20 n=1 Tax=Saccostrea cuccullata TaxID=36930 RepID=UPI002ED56AD0